MRRSTHEHNYFHPKLDSMFHLGALRGQRGDEVLALVVIHPGQRLPVLPHHPEVDLGLHPTNDV